ncbi:MULTISPECIES: nucleotidyltransferase family protein [unclassified Clostridium]|uniref:nucleotidyltransferase family protein n=1 Tax=unclassified Clostridium TaxID=2614128 RepID=UPI000297DE72|nr:MULTISPECIES: nucleotidyltransferase family protein [unclassified Clostridium]EKQ52838.1 MAG: putative MobA-like protein [Clostridium sp. Maddingley MBC34-26]
MSIDGIVLAAGLSSRMEKYKMSLKIGDKTVIERCIESMYDLCSNIIVVGGYNYSAIAELLRPYEKVKLIFNENYMEGMFSSVKAALTQVKNEKFFLIPGDYPVIKKDTYKQMLKAEGNIIIPICMRKKGHPILCNSNLIHKIINDLNYKSLRDFINDNSFTSVEVHDEGILMDLDTIEDYEKILEYYKRVNNL